MLDKESVRGGIMPIYKFWHGGGEVAFLMEIEAPEQKVQELLDEYREEKEKDKILVISFPPRDWLEFLRKKGIKARFLEPQHSIYF